MTFHVVDEHTKQILTQPKLLERSLPVPSGMIPVGGTGSLFWACSSDRLPKTQPTVPSPPATWEEDPQPIKP